MQWKPKCRDEFIPEDVFDDGLCKLFAGGWINGHAVLDIWELPKEAFSPPLSAGEIQAYRKPLGEAIDLWRGRPFLQGADGRILPPAPSGRFGSAFFRIEQILKEFPLETIPQQAQRERIEPYLQKQENAVRFASKIAETETAPSCVPTTKRARKITPLQKNKGLCRDSAMRLWKVHKTKTIGDVATVIEGSKATENNWVGRKVTNKTIQNWIKDLCPDRTPGRRPSK